MTLGPLNEHFTLDAELHAEVIKAAVDAQLQRDGATWQCYVRDKIPPTLPARYVILDVERRAIENLWALTPSGVAGWRVSLVSVGKTVREAQWLQTRCSDALDEQVLTVTGADTTPLSFESDTSPAPDDGWYSATSTYTFTH